MTGYESKRAAAQDKLAQPAQEPMQYNCTVIDDTHPNGIPLSQWGQQAPQRTWVGLTEEETETLIHRFDGDPHTLLDEVNARLKEKNT